MKLAAPHGRLFGQAKLQFQRPARPLTVDRDDAALLERAHGAWNGAKFAVLGDVSGYPSHSEADQALANLLAFWTGEMPHALTGSSDARDSGGRSGTRGAASRRTASGRSRRLQQE